MGMTLKELRTTNTAGGIETVKLVAQGAKILVEIFTKSGERTTLSKLHTNEAREFGGLNAAATQLKKIGIVAGEFDLKNFNEQQKEVKPTDKRGQAAKEAYAAIAYNRWLAKEVETSLNDPTPSIPHEAAVNMIDEYLANMKHKGLA